LGDGERPGVQRIDGALDVFLGEVPVEGDGGAGAGSGCANWSTTLPAAHTPKTSVRPVASTGT
jgi:hypothetical protein